MNIKLSLSENILNQLFLYKNKIKERKAEDIEIESLLHCIDYIEDEFERCKRLKKGGDKDEF